MRLLNSRYGKFYGCTRYPECKGTHGAHPDGRPLGTPADRETKDARIEAHQAFDTLWKRPHGKMQRQEAYLWLQKRMGLSADECHIGRFTKEQCEQVIDIIRDSGRGFD
jgi:ssDNA-binding Zn-finger/Zn-ribbon topoisomerase 1